MIFWEVSCILFFFIFWFQTQDTRRVSGTSFWSLLHFPVSDWHVDPLTYDLYYASLQYFLYTITNVYFHNHTTCSPYNQHAVTQNSSVQNYYANKPSVHRATNVRRHASPDVVYCIVDNRMLLLFILCERGAFRKMRFEGLVRVWVCNSFKF